jgi:hypothetical protein
MSQRRLCERPLDNQVRRGDSRRTRKQIAAILVHDRRVWYDIRPKNPHLPEHRQRIVTYAGYRG